MNPEMSEYCEYMWNPTRGHASLALARSLYLDEHRVDPKDKKLAVKTVRAILTDMPNVDLKQCTDEYVTRFLYARKYRTEQAAALIVAYQNQVAHRQDIFGNLTARDPALQRALRAGIPGVLPARDRKGRCVLVILASQWDPVAVPALAVQRAIFLVLEILIQDPRNQHCGFVAVVDWGGFSLRQGGALGAAALRNLISALRGRFPARFKAIHFLSAPLCVQATLTLVKPFLDEKTRNKIFLHGNNLSTLHEHLPTDILPAELGGTGPAFNPGLWAEPVIHSAMKEAEIAANLAQKERESRAKDLVALMQSQNGEPEKNRSKYDDSRIGRGREGNSGGGGVQRGGSGATELKEISNSAILVSSVENCASYKSNVEEKEKEKEVEKENDNKNCNERKESGILFLKNSRGVDEASMKKKKIVVEKVKEELKEEEEKEEEKSDRGFKNAEEFDRLSGVDVEAVNEYREMGKNEIEDEMAIRSEPDGLPDDIETLEIPSETNSNEFEMIPSRPSSEFSTTSNSNSSSKESSSVFEADLLQVEKIDNAAKNAAAISEDAALVT